MSGFGLSMHDIWNLSAANNSISPIQKMPPRVDNSLGLLTTPFRIVQWGKTNGARAYMYYGQGTFHMLQLFHNRSMAFRLELCRDEYVKYASFI